MKEDLPRIALSITEFCDAVGISRPTFYLMERRGEGPPVVRLSPGKRVVPVDAVRDWLRSRAGKASSRTMAA